MQTLSVIPAHLVALVFLSGLGCGLLLAVVAVWAATRGRSTARPPAALAGMAGVAGLEVRDSSMGEFEAARRAA
jgi:hypothetical protein